MKAIITISLALLLVGCAASGTAIDRGLVEQIEIGTTTYQDVVATLGKPDIEGVDGASGTRYVLYSHAKVSNRATNFIPYNFISQTVDVKTTTLRVDFDGDGIVNNYHYSEGCTSSSGGLVGTSTKNC